MIKKGVCFFIILIIIFTTACKKKTRLTSFEMNSINNDIIYPIISNKLNNEAVACSLVSNIAREDLKLEDYYKLSSNVNFDNIKDSNVKLPDFIVAEAYLEQKTYGNYEFVVNIKSTDNLIKDGYFAIDILNDNDSVIYTFYGKNFKLDKASNKYNVDFSVPFSNLDGVKIKFKEIYILTPDENKIFLNIKADGNMKLY